MTTRVDFYHLLRWPLDKALPPLLEKALAGGMRALVLTDTAERVEYLNNLLWTYRKDGWLPHGSEKDGFAEDQPVYLAVDDANVNTADLLVLTAGADSENIGRFARCLDLFDGNNAEAVADARKRWVKAKDAGFELHYWQQREQGGWEEKASHIP